jgi:high-affinity nickel-transport protein
MNSILSFVSKIPPDVRGRIGVMGAGLIAANVAAWAWALVAFRDFPALLGTAFLAYTFGLRHAVDADHIAAIDNVTRKLMQEGKRPVGVGMFFSLGHSFFLLAIAVANIFILVSVYQTFCAVKNGAEYHEEDLNLLLSKRGFFGRIFRRLFRLISHSWQMYFVGFLFGLGFDTATEIGVLGITAAAATKGLSIWSILVFPALFTAGMALVDSTDSVLMLGAYGWAFVKPVRKLYYNMTITFVSVVVAVVIGGIEALGLIGDQFKLQGGFWDALGMLTDDKYFGWIGFGIIALFALSWIVSIIIYRMNDYDSIEVRPGNSPLS